MHNLEHINRSVRRGRYRHSLLLGLLVLSLSSCQVDQNDYTLKKPRVQDVAGTYVPDSGTATILRDRGHYPQQRISIRLEKNGNAYLYSIPDWWRNLGDSHKGFDTGHGTWTLKPQAHKWFPDKSQWVVEVSVQWDGDKSSDYIASIDLRGQTPPYALQMIVGDPDEMTAMIFAKRKA